MMSYFSKFTVKQLHREFLRAGADVMQAFTFYASDDKLKNRGNQASSQYTVSVLCSFIQSTCGILYLGNGAFYHNLLITILWFTGIRLSAAFFMEMVATHEKPKMCWPKLDRWSSGWAEFFTSLVHLTYLLPDYEWMKIRSQLCSYF